MITFDDNAHHRDSSETQQVCSEVISPQDDGAPSGLDVFALAPWSDKAILLVDLDAFFASVEQHDHPAWRGKPVIVGGDPTRRGVVSTASYEARTFGVHSAMAASVAARLCPDAIWTEGHYGRYREVSEKIMSIIRDETPFVQQVSIDEAFADVTPNSVNTEHPIRIAQRIQRRVEELGVTCSIGVGTTKAIAKIASDMDKPRGLTVVWPGSESGFLGPLPVRQLSGIGASSEKTLKLHGIETLGDLAAADEKLVERILGKNGLIMQMRARGEDEPVKYEDEAAKSISNEMSFADYLTDRVDVMAAIGAVSAKVGRRLRAKGLAGSTLSLRIRYANRQVRSIQRRLAHPIDDEIAMRPVLEEMLAELWSDGVEIRLVGVGVSDFGGKSQPEQFSLFEDEETAEREARLNLMGEKKRKKLLEATDFVRDRFGEGALHYGRELRISQNTTGTNAKNPADYK